MCGSRARLFARSHGQELGCTPSIPHHYLPGKEHQNSHYPCTHLWMQTEMTPPHMTKTCAKPPSGPATGSLITQYHHVAGTPRLQYKIVDQKAGQTRSRSNAKAMRWEGVRREKGEEKISERNLLLKMSSPTKITEHLKRISMNDSRRIYQIYRVQMNPFQIDRK